MASIPSFGGPFTYNIKPPEIDLAAADTAASQNALRGLQIQGAQQDIQGRNAIADLFAQQPPGAQLTPQLAMNALARDPKMGIQLMTQLRLQQEHQALEEERKAQAAKWTQDLKDKQEKAKKEMLPFIADHVWTPMALAADEAVKFNKDPMQAMREAGVSAIDTLNPTGLLQGNRDSIMEGINKMDLPTLHRALQGAKDYRKSLETQNKTDADILTDADGNFYKRGTTTPLDVFYPKDGKWVPLEGKAPVGLMKLGGITPEMAGAKAAAVAAGKASAAPTGYDAGYENMTPVQQGAVDWYATMVLGGDQSWRVGLSRNKDGAALIKAVDERVPIRGNELGIGPADVGTNKGIRIATQAALSQNTKDLAMLKPYVSMLDKNSDVLEKLADKAIATDAALANKPINWLRSNLSDNPDVAEYLAQIEIVKNEATRVISNPRLVGQMTDSARHEIESIINGTMPLNATKRVLARIKADGGNRIGSMETQQKELEGRLKTLFPGGKASDEPAPTKRMTLDEYLKQ